MPQGIFPPALGLSRVSSNLQTAIASRRKFNSGRERDHGLGKVWGNVVPQKSLDFMKRKSTQGILTQHDFSYINKISVNKYLLNRASSKYSTMQWFLEGSQKLPGQDPCSTALWGRPWDMPQTTSVLLSLPSIREPGANPFFLKAPGLLFPRPWSCSAFSHWGCWEKGWPAQSASHLGHLRQEWSLQMHNTCEGSPQPSGSCHQEGSGTSVPPRTQGQDQAQPGPPASLKQWWWALRSWIEDLCVAGPASPLTRYILVLSIESVVDQEQPCLGLTKAEWCLD